METDQMSDKEQMEQQYPGWPHAYRELANMYLFEGVSNDFPYIASSPVSPNAYLVPTSIGYVASLLKMTKSQRNKAEHLKHGSPTSSPGVSIGLHRKTPVRVIVSKDPNDIIVKQLIYESFNDPSNTIKMDKDGIVTYCLFSDVRVPTKCYVSGYPNAEVAHELLKGTEWIPNVVYEGRVQCKFTWHMDEQTRRVKNLRGHFQFNKIVGFALRNEDLRAYNSLAEFAVRDATMYSSPLGHPARPMVQEKDKLPMLVPVRIRAVSMWYFRDCPVLAPDRPRRLARISPGLSVDCNLPSFIEIEPDVANRKRPLPAIRDGQRIIANLWHNRLNNFYLVLSYVLADRHRQPGERDDQYQLTNRLQLATSSAAETTNQFLVKVNNSIFKDFYSCEPLGFALISDPKRLLRNASPAEHLGGFPVWICVEADEQRLARCRITALADVSTNYSRRDRSGLHPDVRFKIRGHGILIVGSKGIVFSRDHPQTRVRLLPSDRCRVSVGEQFLFSATFYGLKKGFIVCGIQRLNEQDDDYFEEIESFHFGGDDILFVQELRTHMRQWAAEGHDSPNFGPVADPGELVREYVHRNEINWPELIDVFVCYNAGWVPGESTLMKVHSLLDETDDEVINNMIKSKKNRKKTDAQGTVSSGHSSCPASSSSTDDVEDECECLQKWSILRELTNEEQAVNQLEPELVYRLVELRNAFSSLIARTVNA